MKNNYKEMTLAELSAKESELKSELFNLNFQNKVGQLKDTARIKLIKKDIARIKTVIHEKNNGDKE